MAFCSPKRIEEESPGSLREEYQDKRSSRQAGESKNIDVILTTQKERKNARYSPAELRHAYHWKKPRQR